MEHLSDSLLQLITETATNSALPMSARYSKQAGRLEKPNTQAGQALQIINLNVDMAKDNVSPICQDTGMPTFEVHTPVGVNQIVIKQAIQCDDRGSDAARQTPAQLGGQHYRKELRLNLGPGTPVIHFEQWEEDEIEVRLLLKGGGCENKNIQYSLPAELEHVGKAGRDLEGVYKCILHAIWQAQGQGCSAGFLGVCIGGDRTSGYAGAKEQLFRDAGRH